MAAITIAMAATVITMAIPLRLRWHRTQHSRSKGAGAQHRDQLHDPTLLSTRPFVDGHEDNLRALPCTRPELVVVKTSAWLPLFPDFNWGCEQ
jgi:hypothetical protein